MRENIARPDVSRVLSGLKDFQRDTVDYVFRRLYTDQDFTRRFLIADEVGLGKTLVARGVIAKAIDHMWDTIERIDIIYICSNADIARQNIARLNPTNQKDFALASRITLLPTQISDLKDNKVNLISFTPGTSFQLKSSLGRKEERALLYWMLDKAWGIPGTGPMNVLQGQMSTGNFRALVTSFKNKQIDDSLCSDFAQALEKRVKKDRNANRMDIRSRFEELCERFARARKHIPYHDAKDQRHIVGELRAILASSCLKALEPDLIILDEFQRFKHLLEGRDDAGLLAQELFDYSDETTAARVILLSATPYKMYTLSHEQELDGEDHYKDFMRTLAFLQPDQDESSEFEHLLTEYRRELYRLGDGGSNRLAEVNLQLNSRLKKVMVRTERLAVTANRSGMLKEIPSHDVKLESQDLTSYVNLESIALLLKRGGIMEYWKSAPYLLNFMEDYELKRAFKQDIRSPERKTAIFEAIIKSDNLLLSSEDILAYKALDPGNARLRCLQAQTLGLGAWRLLWIPPSLPYYQPAGPFADPLLQQFTKRLVFSSWKIVPKVMATLLSYDAERQMICSFDDKASNTPEERRRRGPLLRFAFTDDRPTGMPVLGMIYPCVTLARTCDPLEFLSNGEQGYVPTTINSMLATFQDRIDVLLSGIGHSQVESGPEDEAWYWAAPILLDLINNEQETRAWFGQRDLARKWSGEDGMGGGDDDESKTNWASHVDQARKLIAGELSLGRYPDDIAYVLAQMAIAGPGIAALRALSRVVGGSETLLVPSVRNNAARTARSFLTLFNLPESLALLRGINSAEPYWRRVIEYCVDGGLQSVLDEYVHVLRESLGLNNRPQDEAVSRISSAICEAVTLRTSRLGVDNIILDTSSKDIRSENLSMRTRFCLRFGQETAEDERNINRAENVRTAFNSPFWPFVLGTTSVGQEGLDFHTYCHAVVHWNLPSNPVDLEQREGRVHRYKGHAVRKNLARDYVSSKSGNVLHDGHADPWEALFDFGKDKRDINDSDLVPFWVYSIKDGARIERHVPALPLSRDAERLTALRQSLAVYRMVFGQYHQEDLVSFLIGRLSDTELQTIVRDLQIDLSPPKPSELEHREPSNFNSQGFRIKNGYGKLRSLLSRGG